MLLLLLLVALLLALDSGVCAAAENQTIFHASGPRSVGCYRSPTLLATDRTLLAFAAHHWDTHESECNDVGLKAIVVRSTIDGITWTPEALVLNDSLPSQYPGHDGISMGTALWDNRTKTVHFFFATCSHVPGRAAPAPAHCAHSKLLISSTDAGRTWGAVRNITSQLKTMPGIWAPGPATGVQLSDGRLLACGSYRPHPKYSASPPVRSTSQCISSDDSGLSWRVAGFANYSGEQGTGTDHQPNECQPAVLTNGSVLLNSRDVGRADGHRLLALSTDRGDSFGEARPAEGLYDYPSTEGSMIQHEQCLIVSNLGEGKADRALNDPCKTAPAVSPCGFRHNLTIHVSCNGATTWTALGSVWPGPAAYSSLASLPWRGNAVGVLFESGPELLPNATAALAALVPYERLTFATVAVKTDDIVERAQLLSHTAHRVYGLPVNTDRQ